MNAQSFISEINRIFQIAFIQKAFKLVLRSAWVGGAVYLFFWGLHQFFGVLPNNTFWTIAAVLVAVAILATLYFQRKPDKKFVWTLDRRFNLKEQAITAYELLTENEAGELVPDDESMTSLLAKDAAQTLPVVRHRLVSKGWNLRPEFESTLVVLILLLVVYLNGVSIITQVPPGGMIGILPGLGSDPDAEDVFAVGESGSGQAPASQGQVPPADDSLNEEPFLTITTQDYEAIARVMKQLGKDIEDDSITNRLGEMLQNENFEVAAEEFGKLAETISHSLPETRENLGNEFLESAVELQDAGQSEVSQYFQNASASLYGESFPVMSERLDDLARVMEYLSRFQSNQFLVQVDTDQALELDAAGELDESVELPGISNLPISDNESSDVDLIIPSVNNVDVSVWQSYDLSLDDVDVVSTYFSTR